MSDETWEFSATWEPDGELLLEWYKSKDNVVTIGLGKDLIYWAALVEGRSLSGKASSAHSANGEPSNG